MEHPNKVAELTLFEYKDQYAGSINIIHANGEAKISPEGFIKSLLTIAVVILKSHLYVDMEKAPQGTTEKSAILDEVKEVVEQILERIYNDEIPVHTVHKTIDEGRMN